MKRSRPLSEEGRARDEAGSTVVHKKAHVEGSRKDKMREAAEQRDREMGLTLEQLEKAKAKRRKRREKQKTKAKIVVRESGDEGILKEALEALEAGREGTLSDWLNPGHRLHWKELKELWSGFSKSQKKKLLAKNEQVCNAMTKEVVHPFITDPDDHCETAPEAYKDIRPLLEAVAARLGKSPRDLKIYDPYYCDGAMERHLVKLGFGNVYNRNENFYLVDREGRVPEHDVLVTNPPYSGDHVEKLMAFVERNKKPALLLVPNYVVNKPFFAHNGYSFVVPRKRYNYWTPKGLRPKDRVQNHVSTLGVRTSPFVSLWCVRGGSFGLKPDLVEPLYGKDNKTCYFIKHPDDLPRAVVAADHS